MFRSNHLPHRIAFPPESRTAAERSRSTIWSVVLGHTATFVVAAALTSGLAEPATAQDASKSEPTPAATTQPPAPAATTEQPAPAATTQAPAPADPSAPEGKAASDTTRALRGNEEGTALRSLTVEAENKVQIIFERPELDIQLDPNLAPGLDWGTAQGVLNRTVPDLVTPLLSSTRDQASAYAPRPWLDGYTTGPVARFQPQLEGVDHWRLVVANSQGQSVVEFKGNGKPPKEITWDGRAAAGTLAIPGLTYSYVLEAYDKAGNKRNFVGNGFELPPYRIMGENSITMMLAGEDLQEWARPRGAAAGEVHPLILEAASWLNQIEDVQQPITVTVTARTFDQADALATRITEALSSEVLNGKVRVLARTDVRPEAPTTGAIEIASAP